MRKMIRAVARDFLVLAVAVFLVLLCLRIYYGFRIRPAQSAVADFQRLIASNPTQQQYKAFFAKYRAYQSQYGEGTVVIRSPSFPRVKFNEFGYCDVERTDSLIGDFGTATLAVVARAVGYNCFALGISARNTEGGITAILAYDQLSGQHLIINRTELPVSGISNLNPRFYRICEQTSKGEMGVLVGPGTTPEIASNITEVDVRCLRNIRGCSFAEFLPGAARRLTSDLKEGINPCRGTVL